MSQKIHLINIFSLEICNILIHQTFIINVYLSFIAALSNAKNAAVINENNIRNMLNEEKLEKNVEILNMDLISQTINNSNNNNNIGT